MKATVAVLLSLVAMSAAQFYGRGDGPRPRFNEESLQKNSLTDGVLINSNGAEIIRRNAALLAGISLPAGGGGGGYGDSSGGYRRRHTPGVRQLTVPHDRLRHQDNLGYSGRPSRYGRRNEYAYRVHPLFGNFPY